MMSASCLKAAVQAEIPDAEVSLEDLSEDGTHYAVGVRSRRFNGLSEFKQRNIVLSALRMYLGRELCAVSLTTCHLECPPNQSVERKLSSLLELV
jgi:stress-induced morphogen